MTAVLLSVLSSQAQTSMTITRCKKMRMPYEPKDTTYIDAMEEFEKELQEVLGYSDDAPKRSPEASTEASK